MRIKYKQPYWVKFQWDLSNHHENQYVTEFNKTQNDVFLNFLHEESYSITCNFRIRNNYKTDKICMVYGKPGKNMGLSYNMESGVLAFEFWTEGHDDDNHIFHFVPFNFVDRKDVEEGITITVTRDKDKFTLYKNFEKVNIAKFKRNLIDDYKESGLFMGCSNPGTGTPEHRYYGEMDLNYFNIIEGSLSIEEIKDVYETKVEKVLEKGCYDKILCLYDFESINNLGIVYDESKNTNFLERVPDEFILE